MEIIPSTPYPTESRAELKVFDKLKEAFVNDHSYVAFHSLNLTKHETKRFGEADFVIVSKHGIFVFEVKGGGIRQEDGCWSSTNDKGTYDIQNPFRQAEKALHSIETAIYDTHIFPGLILPVGFGVIFPNVSWDHRSSEWDRHTVCDLNTFKNFESWLKSFFRYWSSKSANKNVLSPANISDIKRELRPDFELLEPLHVRLSRSEDSVAKLTEDQYGYLDTVAANKKVLCSGGAGTGKTFLAAELAKRLADGEKNVLFVCKSNWLKRYLETRIHSEFVTISTIESATIDKRRAGVDKYDILIVDEGQDLFNFEDIDILDSLLEGGMENSEWYIFHDTNNQSGLVVNTTVEKTEEVLEYLESYNPAKVILTTNCRNTSIILDAVQNKLHFDMGNKGTGLGPEIHEYKVAKEDAAVALKEEIGNLLKDGVPPASITILSPKSYEMSLVSHLPEPLQNRIVKLDEFSVRSFPIKGISFAEIKNFKGLENEVIIVVDLEDPTDIRHKVDKVLHYVAMSRARGLLCVIWNR